MQEGSRLPSIQRMASLLQVSKNTVMGAYDLLIDSNLIHSEPSRGFFVATPTRHGRSRLAPDFVLQTAHCSRSLRTSTAQASGVHVPAPSLPVRFDFKVGRPSAHAFPLRQFIHLSNQLLRYAGSAMAEYPPPEGLWGLRLQIADYLAASKGILADPEHIIITAGTQESLSLITAHFLDEHSCAVHESPGYNGFRHLLERHRAQGIPVPVDEQGLCTGHLPDRPVQLAFVTPSHQYPLGHTLTVRRRQELLAWASTSGALIIEDDYDGDFCYGPALPAALKAMSPGQVIYLGSFSKTLGPGLRLAYMVCPPQLSQDFIARKALLNNGSPWLTQAVLARFFDEYDYPRHLQHLRRRYLDQRNILLQGLKHIWGNTGVISGQNAGMHLAFRLPSQSPNADHLASTALHYGIRLYPLAQAASQEADGTKPRHLLFGYANLEPGELQQAMQHLALIQPRLNQD
ncbi:PLP-dependent aminotransferase family protein [Alcaligenes faecalis]|uniref:PLP-dependent aminotransferase family protein n=1 Tax=Alcaligenes ammonioxydans TaxID=2582914 RepID=A0ABX8SXM4_9BURK|nr:PLP-dependent aminotransferase family protein [Alcaligenes faecalis]QXX80752.1 PLP-dependent aminotransferase family protein [Alcaligenes ammonioxydans]WGQ37259.1 PLP-dependent aminotransferase family protein [Alcaligenes faecalis]